MTRITLTILACAIAALCQAQEVKIVSWNLKDIWNAESIDSRAEDLKAFGKAVKPDILILQEFTDGEQLSAIREKMHLEDYYSASTTFKEGAGTSSNDFRSSFEAGVLSRYPITEIREYGFTLGNYGTADDPPRFKINPLIKGPIAPTRGGRGYLWVRIDELKLVVVGVHLKSSSGRVGEEDKRNAEKREIVASAIANHTAFFLEDNPDYTVLVAGDFNVGHSDEKKNGTDIVMDCYKKSDCEGKDMYDETHALLAGGLVRGVKMKNLAIKLDDTYHDPDDRFDGGAIDNIYVIGAGVKGFAPATKNSNRYNSDHYPIWTTWNR